jgi:parallel beta-helix repeat protein
VGEINLFDVKGCMVENCDFERSDLWLFNPSDVIFRNITAVNTSLWLNWARKISFENVTLVNPEISLAGSDSKDFEIELKNCTVDGKPVYFYRNQSDLMLDNLDAGYIWLVNCTRPRIRGSKALGIFVMNSSDMILEDSVIDRNGIKLAFSRNCIIRNNIMLNATSNGGIIQYTGCHNNTVDHESATQRKNLVHGPQ